MNKTNEFGNTALPIQNTYLGSRTKLSIYL